MKIKDMKVYIAAPFFNEEQLSLVKQIESTLDEAEIEYFSPRLGGVIKDMTEEEKKIHMDGIFESNVEMLQWANCVIAVIDDYDAGTMWEMGYFYHKGLMNIEEESPIITMTNKKYGLNIMLRNSVDAHLYGIDDLLQLTSLVRYNCGLSNAQTSMFPCTTKEIT